MKKIVVCALMLCVGLAAGFVIGSAAVGRSADTAVSAESAALGSRQKLQ